MYNIKELLSAKYQKRGF